MFELDNAKDRLERDRLRLILEALETDLKNERLSNQELEFYRVNPIRFVRDFLIGRETDEKGKRKDVFFYQGSVLEDIALHGVHRIIILAGRGAGKTRLQSWIVLWYVVVFPNTEARVVAGSFEQARILYNFCRDGILGSPRLLAEVDGDPLMTLTRFKSGSKISVATASQKSVRGPHPDLLSLDEAREVPEDLWNAAKYMIMTSKAPLLIVSTTPPDYPLGYVWDLVTKSEELGYKKYEWSLLDRPDLAEETLINLEKLKSTSPEEYTREVLGRFTSMSGAVFPTEKIAESIVPYIPILVPARLRVMGVDWGYQHPTVLVIVQQGDLGTLEVLYADHFIREEYQSVLAALRELSLKYRISLIVSDASNVGENQRLRGMVPMRVEDVPFSQEKLQMIEDTRNYLGNRLVKFPRDFPLLTEQLMKYSWDLKSKAVHPQVIKRDDDYVDAFMLAVKGLHRPKWSLMTPPRLGSGLSSAVPSPETT